MNLKIGKVVDFEDISGGLLFDSGQFTLGNCTNIGTLVNESIYC